MKLKLLKLYNFKNHEHLEIASDAKVIGIHGLNGMGKTNVLDAIFTLCLGKPYFATTDTQCVMHDKDEAAILAKVQLQEEEELKIKYQQNKRKTIERNGKKIAKVIDHVGRYFAVVIAPGDISLIYGGNSDRRRFIDQMIGQTNKNYLSALMRYNKLLEQRNRHLKSERIDELLLKTLDEQMAPLAQQIYEERNSFLLSFSERVSKMYEVLSGNREQIELQYFSQLAEEDLISLAKAKRDKDRILKRSTQGIHKDELEIFMSGELLRRSGSQGQIKSCLISMKLAEYEFYRDSMDVVPLLLLDDIFEKIDDNRAVALTNLIKNGTFEQLFVTDTNEARLEAFCEAIDPDYQLIALTD